MRNALKLSTDGSLNMLDLDAAEGTLKVLQNAVGGYIEAADLTPFVTMYLNEEGKYNGSLPNWAATMIYVELLGVEDVIKGDVIFTGGVDNEGETLGLADDTEDALRKLVAIVKPNG